MLSISDPKSVQSKLEEIGLYHGPIDGNPFSKATDDAMMGYLIMQHVPGEIWSAWDSNRRMRACTQLIVRASGQAIRIDGWIGEESKAAIRRYDAATGAAEPLPDPATVDAEDDAPPVVPDPLPATRWPRQTPNRAEVIAFFGAPGTNQVSLVFPYPMFFGPDPIAKTSVNKKVHDPVMRVLQGALTHYGHSELHRLKLDAFSGCLNVRKIRGGNNWSMHSWGIALDFDAGENTMTMHHDSKPPPRFAAPEYKAWFDLWEGEGFVSLGRARDFDWMHVQAARL